MKWDGIGFGWNGFDKKMDATQKEKLKTHPENQNCEGERKEKGNPEIASPFPFAV